MGGQIEYQTRSNENNPKVKLEFDNSSMYVSILVIRIRMLIGMQLEKEANFKFFL